MNTKHKSSAYTPSFIDVKAASYVCAVAEIALKEANRLLKSSKLLIAWKIDNCGELNSNGEVTNAFQDVFAIRTKADFQKALIRIQSTAVEFEQTWYRSARCRRTASICAMQGLTVTTQQVESTEAAQRDQNYSCRKAAAELLNRVGKKLPFDVI